MWSRSASGLAGWPSLLYFGSGKRLLSSPRSRLDSLCRLGAHPFSFHWDDWWCPLWRWMSDDPSFKHAVDAFLGFVSQVYWNASNLLFNRFGFGFQVYFMDAVQITPLPLLLVGFVSSFLYISKSTLDKILGWQTLLRRLAVECGSSFEVCSLSLSLAFIRTFFYCVFHRWQHDEQIHAKQAIARSTAIMTGFKHWNALCLIIPSHSPIVS